MKKVLLIAHDFPPRRTSGIYRPTGMCKYLRQFGWEPTVLTVESRAGDLEDPLLLERVPAGLRVVRTSFLRISGWENRTAAAVRSVGALRTETRSGIRAALDRCIRQSAEFVRSCVYFPDEFIGWVPNGLDRALQTVMGERFDAIYTTSPPRATPVIGLLLKLFTGLPWLAEFRDPWYPSPRPIRRMLERRLQLMMLRKADRVVVISKGHAAELRDASGVDPAKISVVSNGYDERDFDHVDGISQPLLPKNGFNLSHFGTVYPDCVGTFFEAVGQVLLEYPEARKKLRINIIGFPDLTVAREASSGAVRDVLNLIPFVGHAEAIQAMHESQGLLLFWGRPSFSRLNVAGKMYEYLRTGRPILALTRGGETEEMIRDGNAGWAVHPEDTQGIKKALAQMLGLDGTGRSAPNVRREYVEQYRYDRLAEKLARVLDSVVEHAS